MKKQDIIEKVKKHLKEIDFAFIDEEESILFHDKKEEELRDGSVKEVYGVSFKTPDIELEGGGFIEGYRPWCVVDAETEEILYYIGNHGYIEIDGKTG